MNPSYKDNWYKRFGFTLMTRGIVAIPKALWDYRKLLGINSQHIDLWCAISAKYRGSEPPTLDIAWLSEAINRQPETVRKLGKQLVRKGLLRITSKSRYKSCYDLSPTNTRLGNLLKAELSTKDIINTTLDGS